METVKAVCEGRAPLRALQWNHDFLSDHARSLQSEFRIPGCVAKPKTTIAAKPNRRK
jgi:hypothetical protein